MPHSMTGYGSADGTVRGGRLQCEIRTVNHRHLNIHPRLPGALQALEDRLRQRVRARLDRGHVNIALRWVEEPVTAGTVQVDLDRARDVRDALVRLRDELGLEGGIDVTLVARQPDVLTWQTDEARDVDDAELWPVVDAALDDVISMREREGTALARELLGLLGRIENSLQAVQARAPARVTAERDRLRDAVRELLDGRAPDDDRLAQEIALLADRLDIREEIVRLETHLAAARTALAGDGPVGRRLAFLGQEMLREINTIGSKANDAEITTAVVTMKETLESFREQIENLE